LKRSVKLLAILITKSISGNLQNSPGENDMHLKARIFAVVLILVSIGLIYYNWHQLLQEREYSVKLAAFAPLCVIGGLFLLIFPSMAGKPTTTKDKIIVLIVFVIGMAAGLINWVLMDPGFFGR
jgi:CDP-diglyceride synthetase